MWGVGGLTWGLMIRYLGVGLGLAIGCGLCSAAGTLVPPHAQGRIHAALLQSAPGRASLAACWISLIGIVLVGAAGMSKEKELPEEQKKAAVAEYNFKMGLLVAIFLRPDERRHELRPSRRPHHSEACRHRPAVHLRHMEGHARARRGAARRIHGQRPVVPVPERQEPDRRRLCEGQGPAAGELFLRRIGRGDLVLAIHLLQDGRAGDGRPFYIGWAVLMASVILFSTILGIALGEWRNTQRTPRLLAAGLLLLAASSAISAISGYLKQPAVAEAAAKGKPANELSTPALRLETPGSRSSP